MLNWDNVSHFVGIVDKILKSGNLIVYRKGFPINKKFIIKYADYAKIGITEGDTILVIGKTDAYQDRKGRWNAFIRAEYAVIIAKGDELAGDYSPINSVRLERVITDAINKKSYQEKEEEEEEEDEDNM